MDKNIATNQKCDTKIKSNKHKHDKMYTGHNKTIKEKNNLDKKLVKIDIMEKSKRLKWKRTEHVARRKDNRGVKTINTGILAI